MTNENVFKVQTTNKTQGDNDFHVFLLQCALVYHEYHFGYLNDELGVMYSAGIDGIFGNNTANAVCAFQRDHDLEVTGVIDASTASVLLKDYNLEVCE